jgi:hypothetical protein
VQGNLFAAQRRVTTGRRVDPDEWCHRWMRTPVRRSVIVPLGRVE